MSDLISRSAVIDVLKETGIIQDNDLGHLVVGEIERIPTAYNVDKVVEELNDLIQRCCYCRESCNEKCLIERIIEIVRGDGVNVGMEKIF